MIAGPAPLVRSFPALAGPDAKILILGSMPGIASLRAGQYYAHPRNAFWPILGALLGESEAWSQLPYAQRTERLLDAGIAVWDVLAYCVREGSLDSAIQRDSEIANDLAGFVTTHPQLRAIALNGRAAEAAFRRHAACELAQRRSDLAILALPSTSPAHAARSFADKLEHWSALLPWLPPVQSVRPYKESQNGPVCGTLLGRPAESR
jgi:TDG/mug DNA glycosylase family protein